MTLAFDLTGRRILITGAARRHRRRDGAASAPRSARKFCSSTSPAPRQWPRRSAGKAAAAIAIAADAASRADIERLSNEIGAVDALVLNAAICPWDEDWQAPEWDASFDRVMAVNVLGPIHAARAFLPGMIERGRGRIVFVGSLAGRMGGLIAGPHYVASKGGGACAGQVARPPDGAA